MSKAYTTFSHSNTQGLQRRATLTGSKKEDAARHHAATHFQTFSRPRTGENSSYANCHSSGENSSYANCLTDNAKTTELRKLCDAHLEQESRCKAQRCH